MTRPIEIVAELAVFTLGHRAYMLRLIHEAKRIGCTGIKLQARTPDMIYTPEKLASKHPSLFGTTYREYREGLEHDYEDFVQAGYLCDSLGLQMYTSLYDEKAAQRLRFTFIYNKLKVPGSRLHDRMLLSYLNDKLVALENPSLILSVGSTSLDKVDQAIEQLTNIQDIVICHTVNDYPTANSAVMLGNIEVIQKRYAGDKRIRLGYSGHDLSAHIGAAAIQLGCTYIERHFALNPRQLPVHHAASCWSAEHLEHQVKMIRAPEPQHYLPAEWMQTDFEHVTDYMTRQTHDQRDGRESHRLPA